MTGMNLATQRRRGTLSKTPDMLTYKGHIYGNQHAGFRGRRPTPPSEGFYGLGSASLFGDGKMHYYGNDEGQTDLPPTGFYGFSGSDMNYQIADMMIPDGLHDDSQAPSPTMGNYMDGLPAINSTNIVYGAIAIGAIMMWRRRK
jgi:hypothetical protein